MSAWDTDDPINSEPEIDNEIDIDIDGNTQGTVFTITVKSISNERISIPDFITMMEWWLLEMIKADRAIESMCDDESFH